MRDVNLNCIYYRGILCHTSLVSLSVSEDAAQRKSVNECSEVK